MRATPFSLNPAAIHALRPPFFPVWKVVAFARAESAGIPYIGRVGAQRVNKSTVFGDTTLQGRNVTATSTGGNLAPVLILCAFAGLTALGGAVARRREPGRRVRHGRPGARDRDRRVRARRLCSAVGPMWTVRRT